MATEATESATNKGQPQYRVSKIYKSTETISTSQMPTQFSRADLEFHGVEHSGAFYEARVFINNPNADENTPATEENSYVGSFYIFGHGGCFGDAGHCKTNNARS